MKAIAVSVSNTIDRAEMDRLITKKLNDTVAILQARTNQHAYRLNDHIVKVMHVIYRINTVLVIFIFVVYY